jgi:hypothetical protein
MPGVTVMWTNIVVHGLVFAVILIAYLLFIMMKLSPRVWAFSDYPKEITSKVLPQTKEERRTAKIAAVPFFIFGIGYPFLSTYLLKGLLGGTISILDAFLNTFGVIMFGFMADLIILDLLIVGTLTPKFVIIAGTEDMKEKEYKDFRLYHAKAHVKGLLLLAVVSLVIGVIVHLV